MSQNNNGPNSPNGYQGPNGYYQQEDEISLRELIEAMLKRKKIIALITLGVLILTMLATFVIMTPEYEARVIISMSRPELYTTDEDLQEKLATRLRLGNGEEDDKAQTFINSPEVVQKALMETGYLDRPLHRAMEAIHVEAMNPYLYRIVVTGKDTERISVVANEIAIQFNRNTTQESTRLMNEMLNRLERDIDAAEENLAESRRQLEETEPYVELERAVLDDPSMAVADGRAGRGTTVRTQETNPAYLSRLQNITQEELDLNIKRVDRRALEKEITLITEKLQDEETQPVQLVRLVGEEAPPEKVSPRTLLNLAIGMVLGLMLGVFAAFFLEYWEKTTPQKK